MNLLIGIFASFGAIVFFGVVLFLFISSVRSDESHHDLEMKAEEVKDDEHSLIVLRLKYPSSKIPFNRLNSYYFYTKEFDKICDNAERFMRLYPKDLDACLVISLASRYQGKFEEADRLMEQSIKHFPNEFRAWSERIAIARELGDIQKALNLSRKTRLKFPDESGGWTDEIQILISLKDLVDAEETLTEAIRRFPTNMILLRYHGQSAQMREEWDLAASRWAIFQKHYDTLAEGYINRHDALKKCGRINEARSILQTASFLFPKDPSVVQRRFEYDVSN